MELQQQIAYLQHVSIEHTLTSWIHELAGGGGGSGGGPPILACIITSEEQGPTTSHSQHFTHLKLEVRQTTQWHSEVEHICFTKAGMELTQSLPLHPLHPTQQQKALHQIQCITSSGCRHPGSHLLPQQLRDKCPSHHKIIVWLATAAVGDAPT